MALAVQSRGTPTMAQGQRPQSNLFMIAVYFYSYIISDHFRVAPNRVIIVKASYVSDLYYWAGTMLLTSLNPSMEGITVKVTFTTFHVSAANYSTKQFGKLWEGRLLLP